MLPPPNSPRARLIRLGAYATPLLLGFALNVPVCPVAIVGRVPCPGCGMTRAALALAHGDVGHACDMNPLSLVVLPIIALMIGIGVVGYLKDGDNRMHHPLAKWTGVGAIAALFVVWVLRWFGMFGGPVPV